MYLNLCTGASFMLHCQVSSRRMKTSSNAFVFKDVFSPRWRGSLVSSLLLLALAYIVEHFANAYAFAYSLRPTTNHVGDLVLDIIPALNLNFIIIEVALVAIVLSVWLVFSKPEYILFTLKTVALFVIIRALFISLTHVGIHPDNIAPGLGFFDAVYLYLNFQTGLFFSGHTGLPFLMALIFWDARAVRLVFLGLVLVFGAAVLLAHIHYSIDVFAAPFMAYGIFAIARYFFPRDYQLISPR